MSSYVPVKEMNLAKEKEMNVTNAYEIYHIVGFHMTSLKFKLKNYRSYRDFTFTMH